MNILVTGAAGYVGSVCAAELVRLKHQIVGYDNLTAGHRRAVIPTINFVQGDIEDKAKLRDVCREARIAAVMHFAASALVEESVRNPHLFYRNNVAATIGLLEVLLECGIKKMVFSSSAAVYGEPQSIPISEDHPTAPVNAYGETKVAVERALEWYHRAYGLECVALRYFNAAGSTASLGEDHRPETHLLPRLLDAVLNSESPFQIYGDDYATPDGTCIRDFVHVLDIAQAHILAMRSLPKVKFGIYNVGHGKGYSIREVVKAVEEVTGHRIPIRYGPRRLGDPAVLVASPRKLRRQLGWKSRHSDLVTIVRSAWTWRRRFPKGYSTGEGTTA